MIKLSVIIPVYNVEEYLTQCIESVLNQIYLCKLEIILVDDGSTDKSTDICDYYAAKDYRIKVIHKINEGTSVARNVGIDAATGDYIVFLDADDFWIENTIQDFIKVAEETQADIIIGNAVKYLNAEGKFSLYPNNLKYNPLYKSTYDKLLYILHPKNRFQWHIWKCFFKAKLIKNNRLYFKEGLLFQDAEWLPRVFSKAKSIEFVDTIFVCYRVRPNSNMTDTAKSLKRHKDMLKVVSHLTEYFKTIDMDRKLKHYFYTNFSETYVYVFLRQVQVKDDYSRQLLKRYSYYISLYKGRYSRQLKFIYNILGYDNTCKIMKIIGKAALSIRSMKGGIRCLTKKLILKFW